MYVSLSVCLFVCLFVRLHVSKTTHPNFLHILPVAVARSSDGSAVGYDMYFRFVDDVMFPYNGRNRSESKPTRIFRAVR